MFNLTMTPFQYGLISILGNKMAGISSL